MEERLDDFDLARIAALFAAEGSFVAARRYGSGHINDTFLAEYFCPSGLRRYILQRINSNVFRDPHSVMKNVKRVTDHLQMKVRESGKDPDRNCLTLVPSVDGAGWIVDDGGETWRMYLFIDESVSFDRVDDPSVAFEGGYAFGEFQTMLTDLPGGPLEATIPGFHDMRQRLDTFLSATKENPVGRVAESCAEIAFVEKRADEMRRFGALGSEGVLPERITHNDTKFNNVLLDAQSGKATCVIDLDTVMPGHVIYDFGDSIRTATNTGEEDASDLCTVGVDLSLFEGYTRGYLSAARDFLLPEELGRLAFSARYMTFIIGLRFLTDYLSGDTYFKVHRPGHNLQRARAQFKLLSDMEQRFDRMQEIVEQAYREPVPEKDAVLPGDVSG